tara:strand:+ start:1013 stop:1237 length:225 start_codon:yes stop_codon:yes gene_type:complete
MNVSNIKYPTNQNVSIANQCILNNKSLLEQILTELKEARSDIVILQTDIKVIRRIVEAKALRESKGWSDVFFYT